MRRSKHRAAKRERLDLLVFLILVRQLRYVRRFFGRFPASCATGRTIRQENTKASQADIGLRGCTFIIFSAVPEKSTVNERPSMSSVYNLEAMWKDGKRGTKWPMVG